MTAETLDLVRPDPADADVVRDVLTQAGFVVGPLVGTSMSIAGPRALFTDHFGTEPVQRADRSWSTGASARDPGLLPLDELPDTVRSRVRAVTFESPVDLV